MSQYQYNPPGNLPPGMPPQYPGGMYPPPPTRTSGAAITSLILGILMCIPLLTQLGAILFGIIGISSTRKPGVGGRGMAIAGLLLGLVALLGWAGIGGYVGWNHVQSAPDRAVATSFLQNLASGNVTAAQAQCVASMSPAVVQQKSTQIQGFGSLTSFTPITSIIIPGNGATGAVVTGIALFGNTGKTIIITLQNTPNGSPKVQDCQIQ